MMTIVAIVAGLAGFLMVCAANFLLTDIANSHRARVRERLEQELKGRHAEQIRSTIKLSDLVDESDQPQRSPRESWMRAAGKMVQQSGVSITSRQLGNMSIGATLGAGLLTFAVSRILILAVIVGLAFSGLPWLWVAIMRARRLSKLRAQLPDAFDLMSRAMRAGQTMSQAIQVVADEGAVPLSDEFAYCYEQQNLGLSVEAALRDLAQRVDLLEVRIFVMAVVIHRQTGGNLSELLDKLSGVIRQRFRIQGMISALTAEGRVQCSILLVLPFVMMALLFVINRAYILELLNYPMIFVVMFGFMGVGALWMHKIINFDF